MQKQANEKQENGRIHGRLVENMEVNKINIVAG
jgi:hypothetical protein